jgi:glycosyltransferase involved in cell wall biosynthesis
VNVAFVLGTSTGGTGAHVAMLAAECAARGITVTVYGPAQTGRRLFPAPPSGGVAAGAAGKAAASPPVAGQVDGGEAGPAVGRVTFVPVEIAARPRPGRDAAAVLRLRSLIRQAPPDVVHAHGLRAGALAALALAGPRPRPQPPAMNPPAGKGAPMKPPAAEGPAGERPAGGRAAGMPPETAARRRPPLLVTVHNAPPRGGPAGAVYLLLEWIVARRADAVCWVSADLAGRVRRRGAADGGRALVPAAAADPPSPAELARAKADAGEAGRPVVFAAGRLTAQKGFGVLLRAAEQWQRLDPPPVLAIAGEGPLGPALAAQARAAGVAVRFLGERGDVPALLAAAAVVVVPSIWEGQPLIVQEALRAGRPLVASRTGGIPALTGEDGALLVPPGDPTALAGAVRHVLTDPDVAARLAAAATARAAELPTPAAAAAAAIAIYERLISRDSAGAGA